MSSFSDLVVKLELQQASFQKGMDQAARDLERVRKSAVSAQGGLKGLENGMSGVTKAVTALGTAFAALKSVEAITKAGDQLRNLQGSFAALFGDANRASDMMARVFGVVSRTGAPLEAVASSTQRLTIALKDLGASNQQIETIAETFIKLGKVGGSSAQETASGLQQLGQALASGKLGGDELKSIRENAPLVAEAIAKGMGVTAGALKQLGEDGKLDAASVGNALIKASADAAAAFAKLPQGFEQATNRMEAQATKSLAAFDNAAGITRTLVIATDAVTSSLARWQIELEAANGKTTQLNFLATQLGRAFAGVAAAVAVVATAQEMVVRQIVFIAQAIARMASGDFQGVVDLSRQFAAEMIRAAQGVRDALQGLESGKAAVKPNTPAQARADARGDELKPPAELLKPGAGGGTAGGGAEKEAEQLKKRGEALAASVDALQAYNQKLAEYNELLAKGAISDMVFSRAVEKAKEELNATNDTLRAGLDPLFAYGLEMEKLQKLYERQIITLETFQLATEAAAKKYQEFLDKQAEKSEGQKALEKIAENVGSAMGEFFSEIISGSETADKAFEKMAKSILNNLAKMLAEFAAKKAAEFVVSSLFGSAPAGGGKAAPSSLMLASRPTSWNAAATLAGPSRLAAPATQMEGGTTAGSASGQGGLWNVTINNNAAGVDVSARSTAKGLEVTVEKVRTLLAQDVARGGNPFSRSLESAYGLGRGR